MSELRKAMAKHHTVSSTPSLANAIAEEEEYASEGSSSTSSMSSAGTIVPNSTSQTEPRSSSAWAQFFEQELYLNGSRGQYHVYVTQPTNSSKDPVFVCHHGAGASGLSFALFTKELRRLMPDAGVLAVEARGHGSVVDSGQTPHDMSLEALKDDLLEMIHLTEKQLWKELPAVVLVGHSLGGAVVTRLASKNSLGGKLVGVTVVDVVEGSAMEALKSMQAYLRSRPDSFPTVEAAVDWHVRSRTIRNPDSASISTPPLLKETTPGAWTWRTDLGMTQQYWQDWFSGMSSGFLASKAAKLLILAGTDRLDKELMIGQMQGKFQLQVFPEAGHFVQEDLPEKTAETIVEFYKRNDRSTLVLPPKVSDLLAQGKKV